MCLRSIPDYITANIMTLKSEIVSNFNVAGQPVLVSGSQLDSPPRIVLVCVYFVNYYGASNGTEVNYWDWLNVIKSVFYSLLGCSKSKLYFLIQKCLYLTYQVFTGTTSKLFTSQNSI